MPRRPTPQSIDELLLRARALSGHTVGEVASALQLKLPPTSLQAKGFVGKTAEYALGADNPTLEQPDFLALKVELKTLPVNQEGLPEETTFCCAIDMLHAASENWETSRLKQKLATVLWLTVDSAKIAPLAHRRFQQAFLWTPNAQESALLQADFEDLMGAIGLGEARRLSAHLGRVLQVRPKAANARAKRLAPAGSEHGWDWTLPLGFYLRTSFTKQILKRLQTYSN